MTDEILLEAIRKLAEKSGAYKLRFVSGRRLLDHMEEQGIYVPLNQYEVAGALPMLKESAARHGRGWDIWYPPNMASAQPSNIKARIGLTMARTQLSRERARYNQLEARVTALEKALGI